MNARSCLILLLSAVLAAGCIQDAETPATPTDESPPRSERAPTPPPAQSRGAPEVGAAAAPLWSVGDWWTWEISSERFGAYEVTTVVAAHDDSGYAVGVTDLAAGLRSVWFHVPPMGIVDPQNLAWEMHDTPAVLLDLPLADGKTWDGELEGDQVTFTASAGPRGFDVLGVYEHGSTALTFTWSDEARTFLDISVHYGSSTPWGTARLLRHGSGHTDPVHLLLADDALLAGARMPGAPRAPTAFVIPDDATHVVIGCLLTAGPGAFGIDFAPPAATDAITCEHQNAGVDGTSTMIVRTTPAIHGDWHATFRTLGSGYAFTEVASVTAIEMAIAGASA